METTQPRRIHNWGPTFKGGVSSRILRTNRRIPVRDHGAYKRDVAAMWRDWKTGIKDVFLLDAPGGEALAGLTVAAAALPLNIALAVASHLPPSAGLIAGAIGGGLAALFGGASRQVSGPAAALNLMVLGIVMDFGVAGVTAAALLVGLLQLVFTFCMVGRLAKAIPEAVLAGFMTGVGLKLLDNQIPELLGFDYKVAQLAQMFHHPAWLHEVDWLAVVCGLGVALTIVTTRQWKRFPAGLIGIILFTSIASYVGWHVERVGAITGNLSFSFPQLEAGKWGDLFWRALPLAFLATVESLLSARAVDRMTNATKPFNPNLELFGQGIANTVTGFFSGMPVTGVVVRSSVNVNSGAKTRLSSIVHATALFFAVFYLSDAIAKIPISALAGLLCVIGVRLVEVGTFVELIKKEKISAISFAVTAAGTVSGYFIQGLLLGFFIEGVKWLLERSHKKEKILEKDPENPGVRAILPGVKASQGPRTSLMTHGTAAWKQHVQDRAQISRSAYVHPKASVIGKVVLGDNVLIAAGASVRADEGTPFFIGDDSNIQDGVVVHALKDKWVKVGGDDWAVYVGKNVSMAHQALVHGPCYIGDHSFIGFRAVVHDSVVGSHCYVGIGAVVVGVQIPSDRYVPHGTIVDTAEKAAVLPPVTEAHMHFNKDVVEVNRGLAHAYRESLLQNLGITGPIAQDDSAPIRGLSSGFRTPVF